MAQLKATVGQIQLTTNMIKSDDNKAWTDDYYPSAKSVSNIVDTKIAAIIPSDKFEHPIGSILITSTNDNPATNLGGKWSLIDKEYKTNKDSLPAGASIWTPTTASLASGHIVQSNHSIYLKLELSTTASISGSSTFPLKLGTISPTAIGADANAPRIAFGISDLVEGVIQAVDGIKTYNVHYKIEAGGEIYITKLLSSETMPTSSKISITAYVPMVKDFMADWACDKFYWKRTE